MVDFSKTIIHCSSLGKLTTEPRNKADKDAGNLSETTKAHLIEVYAEQRYGFKRDISNRYTNKGNICEPTAIMELSKFAGILMEKNEQVFKNDWIIGTPDVIVPEKKILFDTKCCYDWITLLENIEGPDTDNIHQLEGYLEILGYEKAYIVKILLDHPEEEIAREKYRLFTAGNYISEESPDFLRKWQEKEKTMRFEHFPVQERILMFEVLPNPDYIEKARKKVEKSREFLKEFHETHKKFNNSFNFSS